jgi:hypothetical protein
VWAFGSALRRPDPEDVDVLVLYESRREVLSLRSKEKWHHREPPLHVIAMTPSEERFYDFIAVTGAVRLI